jgi:hypothetical protein
MKVQVTFEFNSPEEAIAWHAKVFMPEQKPKAAGVAPGEPRQAASTPPPAEGPKRGRGRPPKTVTPPAPAPEAKSAVEAGTETPVGSGADDAEAAGTTERIAPPSTTPAASAALSDADMTAALKAILAGPGMEPAQEVLKRFGVRRGAEVLQEDRPRFIKYAGLVAAKKVDPAKQAPQDVECG